MRALGEKWSATIVSIGVQAAATITHDLVIVPHIELVESRALCVAAVGACTGNTIVLSMPSFWQTTASHTTVLVYRVAFVLDSGTRVVCTRDVLDRLRTGGGEAILAVRTS